jgi:hypothetical protein
MQRVLTHAHATFDAPRYEPIRTPARKLMGTPTPLGGTPMYHIPEEERGQAFDVPVELEGLPELKPEDHQYFGKLLKEVRAWGSPNRVLACSVLWLGPRVHAISPAMYLFSNSHRALLVDMLPGHAALPSCRCVFKDALWASPCAVLVVLCLHKAACTTPGCAFKA